MSTKLAVAWLACSLGAAAALAQSNSLFRRGAQPAGAPAAPPAGGQAGNAAAPASAPPPEAVGGASSRTATAGAPGGAPVAQRSAPVVAGGGSSAGGGAPATRSNDPGQPSPNAALEAVSLYAVKLPEPETIKVHDLVTIIVREDKSAVSDAKTTLDKKWDVTSELRQWIRLTDEHKLVPQEFPQGNPAVDFTFDDKWEGSGKVDRKDSLITRITAEVLDVKPNGNLVLEARKSIKLDEEEQEITLTGVCRSRDVTAQNTVLSTQLADVQIGIEHSGAARDAARRGWLKRAVDFVRPF